MASGQQVAEDNVKKFLTWRASKTDADFRSMAIRGVLSRVEIAKECGFGRSALTQNPTIKAELKALEASLRERGVLPRLVTELSDAEGTRTAIEPSQLRDRPPSSMSARDAERLKRLEQDNASLRAELVEVKRALSRYAVLEEALAESGRLPR
jgi:hypothetical protein